METPDWMGSISLIRLLDTLLGWIERSQQRRALGSMDDRQLNDLGINRATAQGEADKPFWRP